MNQISVVIPSKTASNLVPCLQAIRRHDPLTRPLAVDDGVDFEQVPDDIDLVYIDGKKPFIFARNCNLGIEATAPDDVVLLNDDALLKSPGGFTSLQYLSQHHPEFGVIGAVTNITGQPFQVPLGVGLREVPHIAFVCVFIPRATIERVGLLDERYCLDYGVEDLDYCEACKRAGLLVGVFDGCFVDHASLRSTFRGDPRNSRSFSQNKALFDAKWRQKAS